MLCFIALTKSVT